jgi:hypothetical protein
MKHHALYIYINNASPLQKYALEICHLFIKNPVFLSLLPIEHVGGSGQTSSVIRSDSTVQFSHPGYSHTCDMPRHRTVLLCWSP